MNAALQVETEGDAFVRHGILPPLGHVLKERGVRKEEDDRKNDGYPDKNESPENIFFHCLSITSCASLILFMIR